MASPSADDLIPAEIAYYYPEPCWALRERGWIKTVLLFIDQVALLVPSYVRDRARQNDPSLAAAMSLRRRG